MCLKNLTDLRQMGLLVPPPFAKRSLEYHFYKYGEKQLEYANKIFSEVLCVLFDLCCPIFLLHSTQTLIDPWMRESRVA